MTKRIGEQFHAYYALLTLLNRTLQITRLFVAPFSQHIYNMILYYLGNIYQNTYLV